MTSWMKNQLTKLYNAVSAPVTATRDALAERLQSVRDTASLLYNRMMENMGYGQERLKGIVEKEAEEEEQQQEEDIDLTPHERERALKEAYRILCYLVHLKQILIATLIKPGHTSGR